MKVRFTWKSRKEERLKEVDAGEWITETEGNREEQRK